MASSRRISLECGPVLYRSTGFIYFNLALTTQRVARQTLRMRPLPSRLQPSLGALERCRPHCPINSAEKQSYSIRIASALHLACACRRLACFELACSANVQRQSQASALERTSIASEIHFKHSTHTSPVLFIQLWVLCLYAAGYLRELCYPHCFKTL